MKKRLFIAIPLPEKLRGQMMELEEEMAAQTRQNIRFTSRQNLHVTVYFCGDTDEEKIPEMHRKLGSFLIKNTLQPVSLALKTVHFAPPNRPPRMIWAEFNGSAEFAALVHGIYGTVKEFPDRPEKPHPRPIPHITLARFQDTSLAQKIEIPSFRSESFPVQKIELIASELARGGSKYTVLHTYEIV